MRDSPYILPVRHGVAEEWPGGQRSDGRLLEKAGGRQFFVSGHLSLDAYLSGGFQRGQLHEIFSGSADDNGSAAGFAVMLAQCGLEPGKTILWLRTLSAIRNGGRFNLAGFAELGGDPSALLMAVAPDETALLRSATDALRCDGFGIVVIECWGSPAILDLTASRRLTLSAKRSGVTAVMLRLGAAEQPSTACTRWAVRSARSNPLAANAPGYPMLELTLLRQRAGPSGKSWLVEWDRDGRTFRTPSQTECDAGHQPAPLPGDVVPVFGVG
ncbi:ImuA family protein [Pontixanthobacter sp.]|uniref:ImuA family protein n=1 Tax=Pontixanthobacter sp. TaxID=2792078 RepID=UPI003C7C9405